MNSADSVELPRALQKLRGSLDARLGALEKALGDPGQHGSLEKLILDLARVATDEADAAARQACVEVQRQAAEQTQAALQIQRDALVSLRRELDAALAALEQAQLAIETERATVTQLRGTLSDLERRVEAEGAELEFARAELDATQSRLDSTRVELKSTRGELDSARHQLDGARRDAESRSSEASGTQTEHEQALGGAQQALREAETRAEIAEGELALLHAAVPPAAAPRPVAPNEEFRGVRAAKRLTISGELDIEIDGVPAKLVDVSVTGAQILASASMKPNRLVRLTLPSGDQTMVCKAKIMWSRLEPRAGQMWYRAGLSFTAVDQIALETFIDGQDSPR